MSTSSRHKEGNRMEKKLEDLVLINLKRCELKLDFDMGFLPGAVSLVRELNIFRINVSIVMRRVIYFPRTHC